MSQFALFDAEATTVRTPAWLCLYEKRSTCPRNGICTIGPERDCDGCVNQAFTCSCGARGDTSTRIC